MSYKIGQLVIYQNGDSFEVGKIERIIGEDGAWVKYHTGETLARTPYECLHPIVNEYVIESFVNDKEEKTIKEYTVEMFGQFKTRILIKAENEQEAKEEAMDKLYEETNHIIDIEIIDIEGY